MVLPPYTILHCKRFCHFTLSTSCISISAQLQILLSDANFNDCDCSECTPASVKRREVMNGSLEKSVEMLLPSTWQERIFQIYDLILLPNDYQHIKQSNLLSILAMQVFPNTFDSISEYRSSVAVFRSSSPVKEHLMACSQCKKTEGIKFYCSIENSVKTFQLNHLDRDRYTKSKSVSP